MKKHDVNIDIKDATLWIIEANYKAHEFTFCSDECSDKYHLEHGYEKNDCNEATPKLT